MFHVLSSEAKIRVFEIDYQELNMFESVWCYLNKMFNE